MCWNKSPALNECTNYTILHICICTRKKNTRKKLAQPVIVNIHCVRDIPSFLLTKKLPPSQSLSFRILFSIELFGKYWTTRSFPLGGKYSDNVEWNRTELFSQRWGRRTPEENWIRTTRVVSFSIAFVVLVARNSLLGRACDWLAAGECVHMMRWGISETRPPVRTHIVDG